MLKSCMKKWSDFSSSPVKPLFWMLIGPLLVLLTLLISLPKCYLFLPCTAIFGFLIVWKWRLQGLFFVLLAFIGYLVIQTVFSVQKMPLWHVGWGCSFALGLVISYLSMEELKKFYCSFKKEKDQSIVDLKLSLHTLREKAASEKRCIELELEKLQENLQTSHGEIQNLLQLVEASRVEAEKVFKQNEILSSESLRQHRQIETLKLKVHEHSQKLQGLQNQHIVLLKENRTRLKKLNRVRTEYAQMQLLFDATQIDFQKFRSVILNQRQQLQKNLSSVFENEKPKQQIHRKQDTILQTLEQDKLTARNVYEKLQKDHKQLTCLIKQAKQNKEAHVNVLENEMVDKKRELQQVKSTLVSLEREIFVLKKEMQQAGLGVS